MPCTCWVLGFKSLEIRAKGLKGGWGRGTGQKCTLLCLFGTEKSKLESFPKPASHLCGCWRVGMGLAVRAGSPGGFCVFMLALILSARKAALRDDGFECPESLGWLL